MKTYQWLSILTIPTATFLVWLLFIPRTTAIYAPPITEIKETKVEIPEIPAELQKIGWCETRNQHWKRNGQGVLEVVVGKANPKDIGKYQINLYWHEAAAKRMGLDLFNEQDNETYALYLYRRFGPAPWVWSYDWATRKCKNANELDSPDFWSKGVY